MSVTGIEKLEFGVEDLTHCAKFMRDFGLTGDASGQRFTTLSGARVELNPIDSPDLPPAFEAGNTLRRMTGRLPHSPIRRAAPEAGAAARLSRSGRRAGMPRSERHDAARAGDPADRRGA